MKSYTFKVVLEKDKWPDEPDDILTPEEEELKHGEGIPWEQVKKELKMRV